MLFVVYFLRQKNGDFWDPKTAEKNTLGEAEAGVCRWSQKDESLRETSEFLEFIDKSEFRLVPEELYSFKNT